MRACRQKLVKFCTLTHTLTHAAKLVVRMTDAGLRADDVTNRAERRKKVNSYTDDPRLRDNPGTKNKYR